MNRVGPQTQRVESFRSQVLESYISRGSGAHKPLSAEDIRRNNLAYAHYLRGWVPDGARHSWLDVACGQGATLQLATGLGFEKVEGVDISEEMLATCRAKGFTVYHEDVCSFLRSRETGTCDVVSAFDVLEHFSKADGYAMLVEIRRILKSSGVCIVQVPNAASPWGPGVMASDLTHETSYAPPSLLNLAKLAGFRSCTFREAAPPPTSVLSRIRGLLWQSLRGAYAAWNLIETGSSGEGVYTRVMLVRLQP